MKKRVLCVILTEFFVGGGLTTVMLNYYRELWRHPELANQYIIDFLSTNEIDDALLSEIESHGCHYYRMPKRFVDRIGHYKAFTNVVKQGHYDILHYNCNSGTDAIELAIARKYITKRICHVHSMPVSHHPLRDRLLKKLLNVSYTHAVAVSVEAGDYLYGKDTDFLVLNNAIRVEDFCFNQDMRNVMRSSLSVDDGVYVVGNVGRMAADNSKNHGFLIHAFARALRLNPSMMLVIVGDGPLMDRWVSLVEELGISDKVIFAGFQTNVSDYLQAFDLFCFPSSHEGLGIVTIEAQSAGLCCLCSTAVPHVVALTDSVRFLEIDDGSEEQWASTIADYASLGNVVDRKSTTIPLQIQAGGFDISTEIGKLIKLYG